MKHERFDVRLTPEEAAVVLEQMLLVGMRKKADYLRACLLAGTGAQAEALSHELGNLGLAVNELLIWLSASRHNRTPAQIRGLSAQLTQLVERAQILLSREGG